MNVRLADRLDAALAWPQQGKPELATALDAAIEREVSGVMDGPDGFAADIEHLEELVALVGDSDALGTLVQRLLLEKIARRDRAIAERMLNSLDQLSPHFLDPVLAREIEEASANAGA